jgi:arylsulfatase A-like enzyme
MTNTRLRFFMTWVIAATPFLLGGWASGRLGAWRHAYVARGLPNVAAFASHQNILPGLALGLTFGFWIAMILAGMKFSSRHPLRVRRTFGLLASFAFFVFLVFIVKKLPGWREMAVAAAYGGQPVSLVFGIILLGVITTVQATQAQRLFWISAVGFFLFFAGLLASAFEKIFFKTATREIKPRRWPDKVGIVLLVCNLVPLIDLAFTGSRPAPRDLPPVFWISIDTLRADHLSLYGYGRETDANLKKLAKDGVVVDQFISQAPWTLPAHATMFSGLDPMKHGVTTHGQNFSPQTTLFPEVLKDRGYQNGAVTTSLLLAPSFGFDAGFDFYKMNIEFSADEVLKLGMRWLSMAKQPAFLFLHFFDPHYPYSPPPKYLGQYSRVTNKLMDYQRRNFFEFENYVRATKGALESVIDRYDEEIFYTDQVIGKFIEELKKRGLYEKSWIFLVSDHGEEFLEHGLMGHSTTMYEELTRVPLIVKAPGNKCGGTRLSGTQVPQSAIAEMILSAAKPAAESAKDTMCDERDGVPALLHRVATNGPVLAETRVFGPVRFMARTPEWKLHSPASIMKSNDKIEHGYELFHLFDDPSEKLDLFEKGKAWDLEKVIEDAYKEVALGNPDQPARRLDMETVKQLKSLGYLQ